MRGRVLPRDPSPHRTRAPCAAGGTASQLSPFPAHGVCMCLSESPPPPRQPGPWSSGPAPRGCSHTRTEVEKPEDPVHGVLDIGRVVFQAKDEELLFIKNGEPVQKIHGVQPDLQPHLGPEKKALPRAIPSATARLPKRDGASSRTTPKSDPSEHVLRTSDVKHHVFLLLARIPTQGVT